MRYSVIQVFSNGSYMHTNIKKEIIMQAMNESDDIDNLNAFMDANHYVLFKEFYTYMIFREDHPLFNIELISELYALSKINFMFINGILKELFLNFESKYKG